MLEKLHLECQFCADHMQSLSKSIKDVLKQHKEMRTDKSALPKQYKSQKLLQILHMKYFMSSTASNKKIYTAVISLGRR